MKSVQIRSFFWSVFSLFELNTEFYSVNLCIQSEYRKIRTRKTPYLDPFHKVFVILKAYLHLREIFFNSSGQFPILFIILKGLNSLRTSLSHLREHKFKDNFQGSSNPFCNCGHNIESTTHFLLHWPLFANERSTFFSTLSSLDCNLSDNADSTLTHTLLFGNTSFKSNKNLEILIATTDYNLQTKRFDEPLF